MITDPRHLRENKKWFREWLNHNSESEDDDYKTHAANVLEFWLDERITTLTVGNLYRFDNLREYNSWEETIVSSPSYQRVNANDMNGRPNAALNHYSNYLASFSAGELKAKLNAAIPIGKQRVISGKFPKK